MKDSTCAKFKLDVIAKNVQSIQGQDRENEFSEELELFEWDIFCLSETWQGERREFWTSQAGHSFGVSGGTAGRNGTGIILHRSLHATVQSFHAVSDRLAVLDFAAQGKRFRVLAVYMPHSGYNDVCVEPLYEQLAKLVKEENPCPMYKVFRVFL